MKIKFTAILICIILLMSLVGCGGDDNGEPYTETSANTSTYTEINSDTKSETSDTETDKQSQSSDEKWSNDYK